MFKALKIFFAFTIIIIIGVSTLIQAQEQNQPVNFYTCNQDFDAFYPVEFNGGLAQDGWAVQVLCAGADGTIDPPDENGNPTGDDFLANEEYNNVQVFYINSAANAMPMGNFWMLTSLNCRAEDFMTGEQMIRVGDAVYLRAFNHEDPAEATEYLDMENTYIVTLQTAGMPLDEFGTQFTPAGIGDGAPDLVITEYKLHQNFPNPFNPTTTIQYDVLESGKVFIKIYNITGQEVARLADGIFKEGGRRYMVQWNADDLSSGIYFYRFEVNDYKSTKKLLLLR